jgi:HEAT repeat protein
MGHADPDLRIQAALALGTQRRSEAIDALIAALDDPDVNVRFHAIEALGKRATAAAIERLADIAASGDFFLAFPAIEALVQIGDPLGASRLSALLDDEMLASAAADALGRLGDEDVVQSLVHALDAPHASLEAIVGALVRIHHRYLSLFARADEIEEIVRRTVSEAGRQRIVQALSTASKEPLKQLVSVLGWIPNPPVPCSSRPAARSPEVRHEVVEALVRCGGSALDLLINQLRTDGYDAKRAAVIALGRVGDVRATPALVELLGQHDERGLWVPITGALARLGGPKTVRDAAAATGDPDVAVGHGAIGALNSIGHPEMSERIVSMLDDPNPFTRESAVRIAGYFGYGNCGDRVFGLCRDDDEAVRAAAVEHLPISTTGRRSRQSPPRSRPTRHEYARLPPMRSARSWKKRPRASLSQALDDADSWVRYFAAMGLGRHGDASSLPALAKRASSDPAMHVSGRGH